MRILTFIFMLLLAFLLTGCPHWEASAIGETRYGTISVGYDGKTVRTDYRLPRGYAK